MAKQELVVFASLIFALIPACAEHPPPRLALEAGAVQGIEAIELEEAGPWLPCSRFTVLRSSTAPLRVLSSSLSFPMGEPARPGVIDLERCRVLQRPVGRFMRTYGP